MICIALSQAKITISGEEFKTDRPISILKSTCADNNTSEPLWDEFIDMRCCPGWTIDVEVLVTHQQGSVSFFTEQIVVGSGQGGSMVLYQDGQETDNFINILVEFFPNHSDMYCLSRDCILESYLPKLLTEELLQTASNSLAAKAEKSESVTNLLQSLEMAFRRLLNSINSDSLRSILSKHLHETMGDDCGSISSSVVANGRTSPPLLAADYTLAAPDEIETFRAIACARQFLRYILKDFKKVGYFHAIMDICMQLWCCFIDGINCVRASSQQCIPEPTAGLVEKLLSLYLASAQDIINERDSLRSPSSATQIDEVITFSLFVDFVLVASVWYLQLAFTFVNVCEECKISAVEVNAIWNRYSQVS